MKALIYISVDEDKPLAGEKLVNQQCAVAGTCMRFAGTCQPTNVEIIWYFVSLEKLSCCYLNDHDLHSWVVVSYTISNQGSSVYAQEENGIYF